MKTIHLICAARPNFMKIAPLYHELKDENWCKVKIIHTGQHYDYKMSQAFFDDFNLPKPDYHLEIGSGTHATQTAKTMIAYEELCLTKEKPDLVIVVGDVNATLACSVTAKKIHLQVAHLEAGLRSFDRKMPEELNRVITDSISDYHWIPSKDAYDNLINEGITDKQISFVGNIMIDTYCMMEKKIKQATSYEKFNLDNYCLLTLHRPINVDSKETLEKIIGQIAKINENFLFPVHPRTEKILNSITIPDNIILTNPMGYIDFMSLVTNSKLVISDSGGIQEETTYLGIPCFTLRDSTERPVTITQGTNQLVNKDNLLEKISKVKKGSIPEKWDGKAAHRIKKVIKNVL